jgi:hypothetical protein
MHGASSTYMAHDAHIVNGSWGHFPMRRWSFWEWVAYCALFLSAIIAAADTGFRVAPDLAVHLPDFVGGAAWSFTPLGLSIIATIVLVIRAFSPAVGPPRPHAIPTSLRLQFHPNTVTPTALYLENVFVWYALRTPFVPLDVSSTLDGQVRRIEARQWIIFIVLEHPVAPKQVLVYGNGAVLPVTEVKDRGPRHAIICVNGDIEAAVLDIRVVV